MVIPCNKGLGPLGKFATGFTPTHLEVGNNPRLQEKPKCHSFTKCMVFHVQVA